MNLNAQESTIILLNYSAIEKKVIKSNEEIKNPKANAASKTWVKRGEIMQDVYRIDLEQVYDGMPTMELKLYYKEPLKQEQVEFNGKMYNVFQYERMHFYFQNDQLALWKRIKSAYENPLDEAVSSYKKAVELDKTNKVGAQIKKNLDDIKNQLKQLGINHYYSGNRESALNTFKLVNEVNNFAVYQGLKDTLMLQYCGIISRETGDYKQAIFYYSELNKLRSSPDNYLLMKRTTASLRTQPVRLIY